MLLCDSLLLTVFINVFDLENMNGPFWCTHNNEVSQNRKLQTVNVCIVDSSMKWVSIFSFRKRPYSNNCSLAWSCAKKVSWWIDRHFENWAWMSKEGLNRIHLCTIINWDSSFSDGIRIAHVTSIWEVCREDTSSELLILDVNWLNASHIL